MHRTLLIGRHLGEVFKVRPQPLEGVFRRLQVRLLLLREVALRLEIAGNGNAHIEEKVPRLMKKRGGVSLRPLNDDTLIGKVLTQRLLLELGLTGNAKQIN